MKKINLNECRTLFLDFFEARDHVRLKSFSLVPEDDPSLLLINAGMAPLKLYFMGEKKMAKNRATSSQCCVRTADIDNVGKTARHGTFFEMLGNFSFGDYFKREAIHWAWTFLTEEISLDKDRLWVSVFIDDDEAYGIWKDEIGIPTDRILKLGKEDNFWELDQGPCGPCSEIHYDRGPAYGEGSNPTENSDRFMEIWNLVFTQFDRQSDGTTYIPLAHPNIDTGMGLERLALITEDKDNIFELEEFMPLREKIEELSGKKYGQSQKVDESMRIIIDHSKAMTFLIHDGVVPSNEGRGYILRRLIRRAYRHGKLLGIEGEFLTKTMSQVIPVYKEEYPGLTESRDRIFKIAVREEENFQKTIDQGLELLESRLAQVEESGEKVLSGEDAFKLYDTYGFPLDLTWEITKERGIEVDEEAFHKMMEDQRIQSRTNRKGGHGWEDKKVLDLTAYPSTNFTGYESFRGQGKVLALFHEGKETERLEAGQEGQALLDQTPFYGEGGGQVGDRGYLEGQGWKARVLDTQKDKDDHYIHVLEVLEGTLSVGDDLEALLDRDFRRDVMKNHSATHLLNKALHQVLGDHVNQAGSYVDDRRLRFDFSHYEAMTDREIEEVEAIVNWAIYEAYPVHTDLLPLKEAMETGAIGIFEDKYKDHVRVVSMGDFSKELCGGTHVENTARIGSFRILFEQGISSGIRRIEAVTGRAAYAMARDDRETIRHAEDLIKVGGSDLEEKILKLLDENKELKRSLASMESKMAQDLSKELESRTLEVQGFSLVKDHLSGKTMDELKGTADALKEGKEKMILVLASDLDGKVFWVVSMDEAAVKAGGHAGKLVKELAQITGGNGGGRPNFATAGGKDPEAIDEALAKLEDRLKEQLK